MYQSNIIKNKRVSKSNDLLPIESTVKNNKVSILMIVLLFVSCTACKKTLEPTYPPVLSGVNVFNNDITAASALTGILSNISSYSFRAPSLGSISKFASLSADELAIVANADPIPVAFYKNALLQSINTKIGGEIWKNLYRLIFTVNTAVEGIQSSQSLTLNVKNQLLGEAFFLRAYFYFYLVNLYGDVPLALTQNYEINRVLPKTSSDSVYKQIILDLKSSEGLLSSDYLDASVTKSVMERVRPTKWSAMALLSRVYLFQSDWSNSEQYASKVIQENSRFSLVELNKVFLNKSNEAIWQLQPIRINENTPDALSFIIPASGPNRSNNDAFISKSLIDSFQLGDERRFKWIDSTVVQSAKYYYPSKYRAKTFPATSPVTAPTEYTMAIRLAELYLIRAEARINLDNSVGAIDDLNQIRRRARSMPTPANPNPLPDYTNALTKDQVKNYVMHERQLELFTEWGHRWLDLKRTKTVDAVMSIISPIKGGAWQSFKQWYPIPMEDIERNGLLKQNAGY
jgi:hypothetical protein